MHRAEDKDKEQYRHPPKSAREGDRAVAGLQNEPVFFLVRCSKMKNTDRAYCRSFTEIHIHTGKGSEEGGYGYMQIRNQNIVKTFT